MTKTSADVREHRQARHPLPSTCRAWQGCRRTYGDDIAAAQGYRRRAPYCAGYACGYHLVRCYLDATGADIAEATLLPPSHPAKSGGGVLGLGLLRPV
ncbi:MAG: DUF2268 domain-containing putative Zn-dependent protease [Eggerthellaceae bacterium]